MQYNDSILVYISSALTSFTMIRVWPKFEREKGVCLSLDLLLYSFKLNSIEQIAYVAYFTIRIITEQYSNEHARGFWLKKC